MTRGDIIIAGIPDHQGAKPKPFLIVREESGDYGLILRETHFNSQNYPIVRETKVGETFATTNAARAYARTHHGAVAGEFAVKR